MRKSRETLGVASCSPLRVMQDTDKALDDCSKEGCNSAHTQGLIYCVERWCRSLNLSHKGLLADSNLDICHFKGCDDETEDGRLFCCDRETATMTARTIGDNH
jgi:hypothetical protein